MILFVDTEHSSGWSKPWAERLQAARTRLTYRLEDLTGTDVHLVRYDRVDADLIARLGVRAMFLSGSATPLDQYGAERDGIHEVIARLDMPMFGFCGGLQMMATALGTEVGRMGRLAEDEDDPFPDVHPGMRKEYGYQPTPLTSDHALFENMSDAPVMRHAHTWELKEVPEGFGLHSSTEVCAIQMIVHDEMPIVGTQFHPEYWTDEHPEGRTLIHNFCHRAELLIP